MTDTPEAVLKPCPFCGSQPGVLLNQTAGYRVVSIRCHCGVRGADHVRPSSDDSNLAEAIVAWNTRVSARPDDSAVERVARALMLHHDCDPDVFVGMHGGYGHWLDAARGAIAALGDSGL